MVAYALIPVVALQLGWLMTPVPREDLRRLVVDRDVFWAGLEFNQRYGKHLRLLRDHCEQAGRFRSKAVVQEMIDEVDRRHDIWQAGAYSWPGKEPEPYDPRDWTWHKFALFRGWIGREAYYAGRLPPVVPYEFFTEVPYGPVPVPPVGPVVPEFDPCTPR